MKTLLYYNIFDIIMYYIITFAIIGFIISYYVHYLPTINDINNEFPKKLILFWNNKTYHIHHWITFSIIIIILYIGSASQKYVFNSIIGLCLGTIFEDFLFDDIFKIEKTLPDINI
tara:strand:+ start:7085 stop:7432 length:348 start_codon:yes stop_codon:yes gene_type:complete